MFSAGRMLYVPVVVVVQLSTRPAGVTYTIANSLQTSPTRSHTACRCHLHDLTRPADVTYTIARCYLHYCKQPADLTRSHTACRCHLHDLTRPAGVTYTIAHGL